MKEAEPFHIRITFKVYNDIVLGLKFCNVVKKLGMVVEKAEQVIGTFAPTNDPHVFNLEPDITPEGFFKRGDYSGKAMLADADGNIHWQMDYPFRISKHW